MVCQCCCRTAGGAGGGGINDWHDAAACRSALVAASHAIFRRSFRSASSLPRATKDRRDMARSAAAKADADERDVVPAVDDSVASGATGGSTAQRERRRRILDATLALGLQGWLRRRADAHRRRKGRCRRRHSVPLLPVERSTCWSPRCRASSSPAASSSVSPSSVLPNAVHAHELGVST